MAVRRAAWLATAVAAVLACQGKRREPEGGATVEPREAPGDGVPGFGSGSSTEPVVVAPASDGGGIPDDARKAAVTEDPEPPPADPSKQIAELGAIPAWQAVIDRAQLLGRRGQKGVVYGRIGPAVQLPVAAEPAAGSGAGSAVPVVVAPSPYVWLVDDSEGNGALGIRLALGGKAAKEGDRVAASGAWSLDSDRRWFWKVDALQPLAPAPPSALKDPPTAIPAHIPAPGGFPPNVRPIKQAKDNDAVYFQLAGPLPARDGDGWLVATQLYDLPIALVVLPGERPSYGGQDMRTPDERWQLKPRVTYWLRIGKVRSQGAGKPFIVNARTAPIRVQ